MTKIYVKAITSFDF